MTKLIIAFLGLSLFTLPAIGDDPMSLAASYKHEGKQYPPVFFVTNIEDKEFKSKLEAYGAFDRIDTDAVGLPVGLRVLKGFNKKRDGARVSTELLAVSTLGLIPVVSNQEFIVRYELFVQGTVLAKFQYQVDSTEVKNIWSERNSAQKTKPDEDLFMELTIPQFLSELKQSAEAQEIFKDYWEYF